MKKPELLAPVGSLEGFHAALEAGADAVYLGLQDFNARLRATNFTMQTLSYLVPFAHKRKVKIYCTLNTLVKQNELRQVIDLLYQLEKIGIDAVILQDLGIAEIARNNFSKLTLHASTQMVVHNSLGARAVQELGFKRITLSRECTLSEIEAIKKSTELELEVFIHGALCYSISGLCLASSYLGGKSGNRGCCTQVCRRQFAADNTPGFFFSPKDLCALDFIPDLKSIGITSFKIEGRMKSADYIYTVVSSYRKAIDTPNCIPEIKNALRHDFGREKTHAFFPGPDPKGVIDVSSQPGAGILLGSVIQVRDNFVLIDSKEKIAAGDKIRFHLHNRADGFNAKVISIKRQDKKVQVFIKDTERACKGATVYLISKNLSLKMKWGKKQIDCMPVSYPKACPFSSRILRKYAPPKKRSVSKKKSILYLRFDNFEWLYHLKSIPCDGIILHCGKDSIQSIKRYEKIIQKWISKLIFALPPFIPQQDIPFWKESIADLKKRGITTWMCSHISQKYLFPPNERCFADTTIWCTNRATQVFLEKSGFSRFTYSLEDDILNLKATANEDGIAVLFAYISLFISRLKPSPANDSFLTENQQAGFFTQKRNGFYYLLGERPLCLTHRRDKLAEIGINTYILDFSFCPVQRKIITRVFSHFNQKKKLPDSTLFNHKGGLK